MIWLPLSSASPSTALKLELSLSLPPRNTLLLFIIGSTPVLHFQRLQVFPSGRGPVFSAGQSRYWSLAWDLCRTESELSHEWSMRHWPPVPWLYSCWGGLNCHAPGRSVEFCVSAPPPPVPPEWGPIWKQGFHRSQVKEILWPFFQYTNILMWKGIWTEWDIQRHMWNAEITALYPRTWRPPEATRVLWALSLRAALYIACLILQV